jgi:hypothetical protein
MNNYFKPGQAVYMLNPSLTLQNTDEDILCDILLENGVDREKIEKAAAIRNKIMRTQRLCNYTSIFDLDTLERSLSSEATTDHDLSVICQKEIVISRGLLMRVLQSLKRRSFKEFSAALASFGALGLRQRI